MGASERRKGVRGEQEVARLLGAFGLPVQRVVNQSGVVMRGDLTGVPGLHFEVKRQEVLRLPSWLRQVERDVAGTANMPVLVFRTSSSGPVGDWHAVVRLRDLARILALKAGEG